MTQYFSFYLTYARLMSTHTYIYQDSDNHNFEQKKESTIFAYFLTKVSFSNFLQNKIFNFRMANAN